MFTVFFYNKYFVLLSKMFHLLTLRYPTFLSVLVWSLLVMKYLIPVDNKIPKLVEGVGGFITNLGCGYSFFISVCHSSRKPSLNILKDLQLYVWIRLWLRITRRHETNGYKMWLGSLTKGKRITYKSAVSSFCLLIKPLITFACICGPVLSFLSGALISFCVH